MKNLFNSIKIKGQKANTFDLSHDVKFSSRMGELTPVMALECIPGDRISLGADSLVRFAPLIAPVMHRFNATVHYFFVPNRIIWDGFQEWMETQGGTGTHPYIQVDNGIPASEKRAMGYFGIPQPSVGAITEDINALPFAAYQKIYNDYYRDQNLINEVIPNGLIDGNNNVNRPELLKIRNRAWMHDYFSAALPFAQKGAEVDIPLGDVVLDTGGAGWPSQGRPGFKDVSGGQIIGNNPVNNDSGGAVSDIQIGADDAAYDPDGTLTVAPTTINELRRAFRLQEWLEKMARGGSRYIEQILAHFGVRSSDKRLDRPEYITGVKTPVVVSEVLNTTGETAGLPQGNMAGHAVSVGSGNVGSYFCEEHGWIIGIMSIMPLPAYQQGIFKPMLHRTNILEYYWPSFAHIGEQEIRNKELYAYTATGNETFGYIPRYAEYRYMPNRVAGDMLTSLDYWHCARIFGSQPALNQNFIECNPNNNDLERIFAVVAGDDNLYIQIVNKVKARRLLPVYGTPNL